MTDMQGLKAAIQNLENEYPEGWTNTADALKVAREQVSLINKKT